MTKKNDSKGLTTAERINELKANIESNSKDARYARRMVNELLRLKKSECEMNKEIDVNTSDVKDVLDIGPYALKRTNKGILFIAKGGITTLVEPRMASVHSMLVELLEMSHNEDKDSALYNHFLDAVAYVFQAPIFASMSSESLFDIATSILRSFNDYADKHYSNAETVEETEQDNIDNANADLAAEVMEQIIDAPIPKDNDDIDF